MSPTLAEVLEVRTAAAAPELVEPISGSHPLLRVRPRVPDSRRRGRRLQGALRPRRRAARAVGLRRRRAVRSDREEAVLPRASRRARLQLRHARLRPALLVLPELGDVAGAARSAGGVAARSTPRRARWSPTRRASARASSSPPTTSRSSPREWARRDLQGGARRRPDDRVRLERQRHARACSITSGRGSISTRSISRASTTSTTGSSAAASSRSSSRSAGCTRWASGSRSSRC